MTQLTKQPPFVLTANQIMNLGTREIKMLIDKLLQKVGIGFLTGGSDGGKSFLGLFLAIYICGSELEFLGMKINRVHGSVIIVCTEDSAHDICARLTTLLNGKVIDKEKLRFIFETDHLASKLAEELKRQGTDLVIIDTFGDLFGGNLNDSISVRQFLKPFKKLANDHQCLLLFNHHIGKGKENNPSPSKNDVLGSQSIEAASRTVINLKKRGDGKRILTVTKGNHLAEDLKNKGLVLSFDIHAGFELTGESISYSESPQIPGVYKVVIEEVLALYPGMKSYAKVAEAMKKKGLRIDKNKVGLIWKEHGPVIPNPEENDGRIGELDPADPMDVADEVNSEKEDI
jgi:hypothetical protein